MTVPPGETAEVTDRLFAGAKEAGLLDAYANEYGIPLFDRAVSAALDTLAAQRPRDGAHSEPSPRAA